MQDDVLHYRDLMVSGSVDRAILHLGVPAATAALLQAGFLIADTFWLGRVGEVALAAASTAGFVMWLAQTLGEGAAAGSGAVLAHAVGAADHQRAQRAAVAGLGLAVWGSLLVLVAGIASMSAVFALMGTAPAVTFAGSQYLRVILLGMPAYFLFVWVSAAFRATGDARTPLRLLTVAAVTNVVLDPLLIFGLGPLPAGGVTGAAVATVLSWCGATAWGWHLLGRLGVRPRGLSFTRPPREVWRAVTIGLPLGLEGALFSVIYILLTRATTVFGTPAVAALGIGHKLEVLNYFVCAGMGAAATTLVGQNLGAAQLARAGRCAWRTLYLTILPVGAVTLALVAAPRTAVGVFINQEAVIDAGSTYILLVGMSQVFMALEVVLLGAFAGAGWTVVPAVLEISLTAVRVPLAFWLVSLGWGVEAVWSAIAVTTVVKGCAMAALFVWHLRRMGHG